MSREAKRATMQPEREIKEKPPKRKKEKPWVLFLTLKMRRAPFPPAEGKDYRTITTTKRYPKLASAVEAVSAIRKGSSIWGDRWNVVEWRLEKRE